MSNLAKVVRILAVLALAAGGGLLLGWWKSGRDVPTIPLPSLTNEAVAVFPTDNTPSVEHPHAPPANSMIRTHLAHVVHGDSVPPPLVEVAKDWDDHLEKILLGDGDANSKADDILALIPIAPTNAQVELSQHLVNMVQDDHYDGAAQMLTNPVTPVDVSTVLMNDLLNRNNTLKLPMLLAIARDNDHPLKDQARDMLELLIQQDNGTNWDQWDSSINTWLQDNPQ